MNKYAAESAAAQKARRAFLECESKRPWKTEAKAREAMPLGQRAYECPHCGKWHRASDERSRVRRGSWHTSK